MKTFNIEITDTFGGEANYCWVKRLTVKAKSMQGAISRASRHFGFKGFRMDCHCGDYASYKLQGACIVAFVTYTYS